MKANFFKTILFCSLLMTMISCEKSDIAEVANASASIATTNDNAEKTYTTLEISGVVSSDEGNVITDRGVCWSTSSNPTIDDNVVAETSNEFSSIVNGLIVNTTYYFRTFVTTATGTEYSEEQAINTLSLENTSWKFTTIYPKQNDFVIDSQVDLFEDNTTKFDEIEARGVFITLGTWSIDGNTLTYIWEGADSSTSTYTYTGVIEEMGIAGTYTHVSEPVGTWSAEEM